ADLGETLVIYGWGFGEHDVHILRRIRESRVNKIAVSVFDANQGYCNYVYELIRKELGRVEVVFFDSSSKDCWNTSA
ncbi:TPA: DUF4917 family protein, partial [Aeromonas veronii]